MSQQERQDALPDASEADNNHPACEANPVALICHPHPLRHE
jgi:alpha/beta superfamily hydrolase